MLLKRFIPPLAHPIFIGCEMHVTCEILTQYPNSYVTCVVLERSDGSQIQVRRITSNSMTPYVNAYQRLEAEGWTLTDVPRAGSLSEGEIQDIAIASGLAFKPGCNYQVVIHLGDVELRRSPVLETPGAAVRWALGGNVKAGESWAYVMVPSEE